jgi:hypothetical protein
VAANLQWEDVVQQGEHHVRSGGGQGRPANLDQAIHQGRSGWRHSTFGGGREEVNWA